MTDSLKNKDKEDFIELLLLVWGQKKLISVIVLIVSSFSLTYAHMQKDIYTAEATLSPNTQPSDMSDIASRLSGFGAFSAFGAVDARNSNVPLATSIMKSRNFYQRFIYENMLPEIYAVIGWDESENKLIYNNDLYNEVTQEWIIKKPTIQQSHGSFLDLYSIENDGINIILKVEHYSPYFAKKLLDKILFSINSSLGQKDIDQTKKAIDFLSERRNETNLVGMREVIAKMIEEQTKTLMLANISSEYVFNIIDPSVIPESPSGPNRKLIVMMGIILGFFLSLVIVLVRAFFGK